MTRGVPEPGFCKGLTGLGLGLSWNELDMLLQLVNIFFWGAAFGTQTKGRVRKNL